MRPLRGRNLVYLSSTLYYFPSKSAPTQAILFLETGGGNHISRVLRRVSIESPSDVGEIFKHGGLELLEGLEVEPAVSVENQTFCFCGTGTLVAVNTKILHAMCSTPGVGTKERPIARVVPART